MNLIHMRGKTEEILEFFTRMVLRNMYDMIQIKESGSWDHASSRAEAVEQDM